MIGIETFGTILAWGGATTGVLFTLAQVLKIAAEVQKIGVEMKPNHGSSVVDRVGAILHQISELRAEALAIHCDHAERLRRLESELGSDRDRVNSTP